MKILNVERQRRRRNSQLRSDRAGVEPSRPCLNQHAKYAQPMIVRESRERFLLQLATIYGGDIKNHGPLPQ